MLRFIINRLQLQKDLYKYNDALLKVSEKNPNGVLNILFQERQLISSHTDKIIYKNIHLNSNDMYLMNKETKELEQKIIIFLGKYR